MDLSVVSKERSLAELVRTQGEEHQWAAPWDALGANFFEGESDHLVELPTEEQPTPEDVLYREGFDNYTGVDTALDSSHEGAMLAYGYELLDDDDS